MEKEYQFAVTRCTQCGEKLVFRRVELGAMRGSQPTGLCPECGTAYPLVEIESEVEPETQPEPEPEPKLVAEETAPEAEVEVTPPPEPEPEPEPEG